MTMLLPGLVAKWIDLPREALRALADWATTITTGATACSLTVAGLARRPQVRPQSTRATRARRRVRDLTIGVVWGALAVSPISASNQDLSRYRQFQLGMAPEAVLALAGPSAAVRVVHERPVLIQELTWDTPRVMGLLPDDDAVRSIVFSFHAGALYRILVEYDRQRTEGLTSDDVVEALAARYGRASRPQTPTMASLSKASYLGDRVVATWRDARFSVTLFQPSYLSTFGLSLVDRRLDDVVRRAIEAATRLEAQEAPQRERDRQAVADEEARLKSNKAREANKPTFRP